MRRLVVLAFLALSAVWARPAWACSCAGPPTFDEALANAEVAFVGEIVSGVVGGQVDVRVDRVIKGSVKSVVLLRADLASRTSCELRPPAQRPITYAGPAELRTGPCAWVLWPAERGLALPSSPPLPGRELRGPGAGDILMALLAAAALPLARQTRAERQRRRDDALNLQALRLSR
jgi:hypothetical protein